MTMRAAVLVDVGRLEIRDVPFVPPAAHDVVVQVQAVGLCGTDLHIVAGHANYNFDERGRPRPLREYPQILGHEIAGVVTDVGSDVRDLAPGHRVLIDQGLSCVSAAREPACEYCRSGDSHQCEHYRELGITGVPGGFAEFVTVPAVNAVRLAGDLPAEQAALAEPLGCVHHSIDALMRTNSRYAIDRAGEHAVRTILVCGAGPAGLLFVQYLRNVSGFTDRILVSEPNANRRKLAERFGAETIDPTSEDLVEAIAERTNGRRVELMIEASGSGPIFRAIPGLIRKQATVLLYGHGRVGEQLGVMNQVQFLEPTLVSPVGASGGHGADGRPLTYERSLRLIEAGTVDVASIITHRYSSLDAVPLAFAGDHKSANYVKGVVTP